MWNNKEKASTSTSRSQEIEHVTLSGKSEKFNGTNYQWHRIQVEDRSKSKVPKNRNRSKSWGKFKGKVKCWICRKEGHVKKEYPERVKHNANFVERHKEKFCLSVHDNYDVDI